MTVGPCEKEIGIYSAIIGGVGVECSYNKVKTPGKHGNKEQRADIFLLWAINNNAMVQAVAGG